MSLTRRLFVGALPAFVALRELRSVAAKRRFGRYRWPAGKKIIVENRMGHEWNEAVEFTVRGWHRTFPRLRYQVIHKPGKCGWRRGRIVLCGGDVGISSTSVVWFGHRATEAQARMAGAHWWDTGAMWNRHRSVADLIVLGHEFGHTLGLLHNDRPADSIMSVNSTRITPGPFDRQSLRLLYRRRGPRWP